MGLNSPGWDPVSTRKHCATQFRTQEGVQFSSAYDVNRICVNMAIACIFYRL